jgi:hypothetical protein
MRRWRSSNSSIVRSLPRQWKSTKQPERCRESGTARRKAGIPPSRSVKVLKSVYNRILYVSIQTLTYFFVNDKSPSDVPAAFQEPPTLPDVPRVPPPVDGGATSTTAKTQAAPRVRPSRFHDLQEGAQRGKRPHDCRHRQGAARHPLQRLRIALPDEEQPGRGRGAAPNGVRPPSG